MLNWSASIVWAAFTMSSVSQFDPSRIALSAMLSVTRPLFIHGWGLLLLIEPDSLSSTVMVVMLPVFSFFSRDRRHFNIRSRAAWFLLMWVHRFVFIGELAAGGGGRKSWGKGGSVSGCSDWGCFGCGCREVFLSFLTGGNEDPGVGSSWRLNGQKGGTGAKHTFWMLSSHFSVIRATFGTPGQFIATKMFRGGALLVAKIGPPGHFYPRSKFFVTVHSWLSWGCLCHLHSIANNWCCSKGWEWYT